MTSLLPGVETVQNPTLVFIVVGLVGSACNARTTTAPLTQTQDSAEKVATNAPEENSEASREHSRLADVLTYPETTFRITAHPDAKDYSPILSMSREMTEEACADRVISSVEAYTIVDFRGPSGGAPSSSSVHVFSGHFDRKAVEQCFETVAAERQGTVEVSGAFTRIELAGLSLAIHWPQASPSRAVVGKHEAVSAFLSGARLARDGWIASLASTVGHSRSLWKIGEAAAPASRYTLELEVDMSQDTLTLKLKSALYFDSADSAKAEVQAVRERSRAFPSGTASVQREDNRVVVTVSAKGSDVQPALLSLSALGID